MSLSNRRSFLLGFGTLAALPACGFSPVYGPEGSGNKLQGRVRISAPDTKDEYQIVRHFETRMGRASGNAPMTLSVTVTKSKTSLGRTTSGSATRFHLEGQMRYSLKNAANGATINAGTFKSFTGYSATGNTAATLAAERDAEARLMIVLTDRMIDQLILIDPQLLP